jgi:hypothetical protein
MVTAITQNYTQPISVPKPLTIYIDPTDPRNNWAYLLKNPNVQVIQNTSATQSGVTFSAPDPSIQNKLTLSKTNTVAYNANSITATPTSSSVNALTSTGLNTSIFPTTDQLTPNVSSDPAALIALSSPTFLASETNDPLSNTLFSDVPADVNPPSAIPPPQFALDSPENLYIDPTAFVLVKSADGSSSYNLSLKFDDVDGASSYNIRYGVAV